MNIVHFKRLYCFDVELIYKHVKLIPQSLCIVFALIDAKSHFYTFIWKIWGIVLLYVWEIFIGYWWIAGVPPKRSIVRQSHSHSLWANYMYIGISFIEKHVFELHFLQFFFLFWKFTRELARLHPVDKFRIGTIRMRTRMILMKR